MPEPLTYLNGTWGPFSQARIPVNDLGFIHGVTVTEQIRTFAGRPFLPNQHVERFRRGLRQVGIDLPENDRIVEIVTELAERNYAMIDPGLDLGICFFATPGVTSRFGPVAEDRPTFCVHSYLLPFSQMRNVFADGQRLRVSSHHEVPNTSWPRDIKVRSRLHYYLAEREVRSVDPQSSALLTDFHGQLRETPTATPVYLFSDGELVVSPQPEILSSISLQFTLDLAVDQNLAIVRREVLVREIEKIRSMFLVSTPYCIGDVRQLDEHLLACESPELKKLRAAWIQSVDCDFISQAMNQSSDV